MKSKVPVIIGTLFAAYVAFVLVVVLVYEPSPEDMDWQDREAYNKAKLSELTLGQPLDTVTLVLGKADFSEAKTVKQDSLQVLFYRTHHTKSDGETTRDECTPLLFKNNKLIAWGQDTYQQYLTTNIGG
ncbi:DUF3192 domain-containing protein [Shewanella algidipiscicola]|uniref:DUF3192 domain-containing protein n=1 Tax=Shewanella algidipiscicola TaxID=614070 RepID=A0ABQ4P4J4_9GAMM|nr:DUF3192 domain-containing protein [Shewanella algidipiscicola]GIU42406.1 DUF3192 domain-containing protein [Shewanella algidipiscicola]